MKIIHKISEARSYPIKNVRKTSGRKIGSGRFLLFFVGTGIGLLLVVIGINGLINPFGMIDSPNIEGFNEKVSIKRIRQLRTKLLNELFNGQGNSEPIEDNNFKKPIKLRDAKI